MTEHHHDSDFEQGVMVDVGAGAGALVIYTRDELRGQEIELGARGRGSKRVHTDVLRRKVAGGFVNAAVFGSLPEGEYRLFHRALTQPTDVRIVSGEVIELDWR